MEYPSLFDTDTDSLISEMTAGVVEPAPPSMPPPPLQSQQQQLSNTQHHMPQMHHHAQQQGTHHQSSHYNPNLVSPMMSSSSQMSTTSHHSTIHQQQSQQQQQPSAASVYHHVASGQPGGPGGAHHPSSGTNLPYMPMQSQHPQQAGQQSAQSQYYPNMIAQQKAPSMGYMHSSIPSQTANNQQQQQQQQQTPNMNSNQPTSSGSALSSQTQPSSNTTTIQTVQINVQNNFNIAKSMQQANLNQFGGSASGTMPTTNMSNSPWSTNSSYSTIVPSSPQQYKSPQQSANIMISPMQQQQAQPPTSQTQAMYKMNQFGSLKPSPPPSSGMMSNVNNNYQMTYGSTTAPVTTSVQSGQMGLNKPMGYPGTMPLPQSQQQSVQQSQVSIQQQPQPHQQSQQTQQTVISGVSASASSFHHNYMNVNGQMPSQAQQQQQATPLAKLSSIPPHMQQQQSQGQIYNRPMQPLQAGPGQQQPPPQYQPSPNKIGMPSTVTSNSASMQPGSYMSINVQSGPSQSQQLASPNRAPMNTSSYYASTSANSGSCSYPPYQSQASQQQQQSPYMSQAQQQQQSSQSQHQSQSQQPTTYSSNYTNATGNVMMPSNMMGTPTRINYTNTISSSGAPSIISNSSYVTQTEGTATSVTSSPMLASMSPSTAQDNIATTQTTPTKGKGKGKGKAAAAATLVNSPEEGTEVKGKGKKTTAKSKKAQEKLLNNPDSQQASPVQQVYQQQQQQQQSPSRPPSQSNQLSIINPQQIQPQPYNQHLLASSPSPSSLTRTPMNVTYTGSATNNIGLVGTTGSTSAVISSSNGLTSGSMGGVVPPSAHLINTQQRHDLTANGVSSSSISPSSSVNIYQQQQQQPQSQQQQQYSSVNSSATANVGISSQYMHSSQLGQPIQSSANMYAAPQQQQHSSLQTSLHSSSPQISHSSESSQSQSHQMAPPLVPPPSSMSQYNQSCSYSSNQSTHMSGVQSQMINSNMLSQSSQSSAVSSSTSNSSLAGASVESSASSTGYITSAAYPSLNNQHSSNSIVASSLPSGVQGQANYGLMPHGQSHPQYSQQQQSTSVQSQQQQYIKKSDDLLYSNNPSLQSLKQMVNTTGPTPLGGKPLAHQAIMQQQHTQSQLQQSQPHLPPNPAYISNASASSTSVSMALTNTSNSLPTQLISPNQMNAGVPSTQSATTIVIGMSHQPQQLTPTPNYVQQSIMPSNSSMIPNSMDSYQQQQKLIACSQQTPYIQSTSIIEQQKQQMSSNTYQIQLQQSQQHSLIPNDDICSTHTSQTQGKQPSPKKLTKKQLQQQQAALENETNDVDENKSPSKKGQRRIRPKKSSLDNSTLTMSSSSSLNDIVNSSQTNITLSGVEQPSNQSSEEPKLSDQFTTVTTTLSASTHANIEATIDDFMKKYKMKSKTKKNKLKSSTDESVKAEKTKKTTGENSDGDESETSEREDDSDSGDDEAIVADEEEDDEDEDFDITKADDSLMQMAASGDEEKFEGKKVKRQRTIGSKSKRASKKQIDNENSSQILASDGTGAPDSNDATPGVDHQSKKRRYSKKKQQVIFQLDEQSTSNTQEELPNGASDSLATAPNLTLTTVKLMNEQDESCSMTPEQAGSNDAFATPSSASAKKSRTKRGNAKEAGSFLNGEASLGVTPASSNRSSGSNRRKSAQHLAKLMKKTKRKKRKKTSSGEENDEEDDSDDFELSCSTAAALNKANAKKEESSSTAITSITGEQASSSQTLENVENADGNAQSDEATAKLLQATEKRRSTRSTAAKRQKYTDDHIQIKDEDLLMPQTEADLAAEAAAEAAASNSNIVLTSHDSLIIDKILGIRLAKRKTKRKKEKQLKSAVISTSSESKPILEEKISSDVNLNTTAVESVAVESSVETKKLSQEDRMDIEALSDNTAVCESESKITQPKGLDSNQPEKETEESIKMEIEETKKESDISVEKSETVEQNEKESNDKTEVGLNNHIEETSKEPNADIKSTSIESKLQKESQFQQAQEEIKQPELIEAKLEESTVNLEESKISEEKVMLASTKELVDSSDEEEIKKDENNAAIEEEEEEESEYEEDGGEIEVEEFYVKYKNLSYLHCEWRSRDELFVSDKRIDQKIKRFKLKKAQQAQIYDWDNPDNDNTGYNNDYDELFNPDYILIDRILDEYEMDDPQKPGEKLHYYLIKWKALPYDESSWELEQDVTNKKKIERFRLINTLVPEIHTKYVPKPKTDRWMQMSESRSYKNGNKLREYQLEGINWLTFCWLNGRNCILADEMGLGKTVQSITFLQEVAFYGVRGPFLVLVPLSTIGNWIREFETWTDFNVIVYHGSSASRQMIQDYEFYFKDKEQNSNNSVANTSSNNNKKNIVKFSALITTYEVLLSDVQLFCQFKWRNVIIDEAHRLKNKNCKLIEGLRYMDVEHKVLLTGTPLQNNVEELFSLLNFLEPQQFHSSAEFLQEFGDLKTDTQVTKLQAVLKPMMLRRLKEDVEKNLAPKEETIVEVELTNTQKKYYRAILEKNFQFLTRGVTSSNVPNLMNTMMELRKCCNHPYLINGK
jgi:chromodomain-helicase-DNA-binding protein 7